MTRVPCFSLSSSKFRQALARARLIIPAFETAALAQPRPHSRFGEPGSGAFRRFSRILQVSLQLVFFKIPYKESPKQPICQMEI
jgi:hypothetical protein